MASGAGKLGSWILVGDSQIVMSTWGWPNDQATVFDIHCSYTETLAGSGGPSPAQMGMVLPPGAQTGGSGDETYQTYYLLIQNAGGLEGTFDWCYLFHSF